MLRISYDIWRSSVHAKNNILTKETDTEES